MRRKLLHSKSDTTLIVVKVKNYNVNFRIQFNQLFWMTYTAPAHISNMHKSVYTTKVNEYTVRCNVLNSTFKYLTFLKTFDDNSFLLLKLSLNKCFVRYNNVLKLLVDFHNLEFHLLTYVLIKVTYRLHINLRTR